MSATAQSLAPGARAGAAAPADSYRWWVLVTVVFGAFVSILDNTIVNTAIPKLQAVFGADLHQISYVATGYTMAQGVVVPATGFLANRFGIKKIYLGSLTLFTIGSALCGLATSTPMIIVFRILQGAGGAALFPLSFAILFSVFPAEERGRANGFFGIPVLFAPAIGPTIGGYLVQYFDWRWIFFVNVPIGIAGVIMGRRVLRETPPHAGLRFDMRGFIIIALSLALLLYGLSNLAYDGWNSTMTVSGPVIAGLALFVLWCIVELYTPNPLLDLHLFMRRNYLVGTIITLIGTVGIFGPAFLLPQYLQNLRGLAPFPAGVLLFTSGVGTVIGTITAGNLFNRVGPRVLIVVGCLLTIGTSVWLARWSTLESAYSVLPWILLFRGVGLPFMLQSANTSALDGITGRALPGATTLNVVARNVVAALAIAILTNILQNGIIVHNADIAATVTASNPAVSATLTKIEATLEQAGVPAATAHSEALAQLAGEIQRQAAALSFQDVFYITAVVSAPIILLAFLVRPPRHGASRPAAGVAPE